MSAATQLTVDAREERLVEPLGPQLLKWIGNKQRVAPEIISYFPRAFGTYFEPFLGAGGVLGTLAPRRAVASDIYAPLMEIWKALAERPGELKQWYESRWIEAQQSDDAKSAYETIRVRFNRSPNGADLVFLCRACYGGVVRFRKLDGAMSTPCGAHKPIRPESFADRVDLWHPRIRSTTFTVESFHESMARTRAGDLVYCDPPYAESQTILYGAQSFSLAELLEAIQDCSDRGVKVALSIDGRKGTHTADLPIPKSLFKRELFVNGGRSMLKRFQSSGESVADHTVADRLLLTY